MSKRIQEKKIEWRTHILVGEMGSVQLKKRLMQFQSCDYGIVLAAMGWYG